MRLFIALAASAAAMGAAPAFAQDTGDDTGFNGIYVAGTVSADVQNNDVGSRILFDRGRNGTFGDVVSTAAGANAFSPGFCNGGATGTTPAFGCTNDDDDIGYSGRVGFDSQRGRIVFGAVGEFGKSEITDSVSAFSTTPASYTMTRSIDWEASARGRIGFTPNNSTLFYGAFGPGYASIDRDFRTTNTANAFAQSGKRRQWGVTGGGGVEQKFGRNLTFGIEAMYHRYQDDDARVAVTQGTAPATNPFVLAPFTTGTDFRRSDTKFTWHSIRAVVGFRF